MPKKSAVTGDEPSVGGNHKSVLSGDDVQLGGQARVIHLVESLDDVDPAARERAMAMLVQMGHIAAFDELVRLLHEGDELAMVRAARALGRLGDARAVEPLLQRFRQYYPITVRQAVVQAIGRIGGAEGIAALRDLFIGNWDNPTRAYSIYDGILDALQAAGDTELEVWLCMLARTEGHHRAIRSLGYLNSREAVPCLLTLLESREPNHANLASTIIPVLGEMRDPRAAFALLGYMDDPRLWDDAALALARIKDERARRVIWEQIKKRNISSLNISDTLIEALGILKDHKALDILANTLIIPWGWWETHAKAAHAIANIGGEAAVTALLPALGHSMVEVRRAVITALGRLYASDARIPPAIIAMLEDRNQDARRDAAKLLGKQKESGAVERLIRHLTDDRPMVRKAAADALKRIATPEALAALE